MGYAGKLVEKKLAIDLRRKGFSYREIKKHVDVSKDTLSRWCRNIYLTPSQIDRLIKLKQDGASRGQIIGAKKNQEKRLHEVEFLMSEGKKEVGILTKREKFLIGIALYAAEGTKTDKHVVFSNSDPKLIKFMVEWFRNFCKVENSKIKGSLWIHENRSEKSAKDFWSKLCNISIDQFYKSYIAENRINSRKIRKKLHPYGIFSINISSAKIHRKIMGWIAGITPGPML